MAAGCKEGKSDFFNAARKGVIIMTVSGMGQSMSMLSLLQPPSANDIASRIMKKLDTNGDGVLSADEISKGGKHTKMIQAADANGDGQVTMDELLAAISKYQQMGSMQPPGASDIASSIIKNLDTNGDGVLSASDSSASGATAKIIQAADANGDGKVTMEELTAYISKQQQGMMGKMHSHHHHGAGNMANSIMAAFDTNGDGVLSTSEVSASGADATMIQAADANGDGQVTMDELVAYLSNKQAQSGQTNQGSSTLSNLALNYYDEAQTMLDPTQSSNLSLVA